MVEINLFVAYLGTRIIELKECHPTYTEISVLRKPAKDEVPLSLKIEVFINVAMAVFENIAKLT